MTLNDEIVISHDVTAGVKKQAVSKQRIYSLIDMKKGGILVDLMRNAVRNNDFTEVDKNIFDIVKPFLYNNGDGKKVPIYKLIRLRNKERPPNKRLPVTSNSEFDDDEEESTKQNQTLTVSNRIAYWFRWFKPNNKFRSRNVLPTTDSGFREVCWSISERGSVGETALHLCLLVSTPIHIELGRRLIKLFPKLVNDIYISDEYYGEGALHMAIVNEDPLMVKFLLNYGADVNARCIGNFFCADDQKDTREDVLSQEHYEMKTETNYLGHVYWGEYPLAFAACLELEDCYRILNAKGADADNKDTNGNTVLHMTVISNKINMFDLAYELGANLHVKNNQCLTPLSLAAKLTHVEMFFHILKLQRDVYWHFCDIAFAAYPLEEIDSIDVQTGVINTNNALSVVAFGDDLGHLDMFEGLLIQILQAKWNIFVKKRFYQQIAFYGIYFIITFFAFIMRPAPPIKAVTKIRCTPNKNLTNNQMYGECISNEWCTDNQDNRKSDYNEIKLNHTLLSNNSNDTSTHYDSNNNSDVNSVFDDCYLLKIDTPLNQIRCLFELLSAIGSLIYIVLSWKEARTLSTKIFFDTLVKVPGRIMFLISCLLIISSVPLRFVCVPHYENTIISISMFLTPMYFLFFCRGFKTVGPFVVMIYKMIISDLLCFVIIYMIFVLGFAQAFFVIFRSHRGNGTNYFAGVVDSVMTMFLMSLNEFVDIYKEFDKTDHPYMAKLCFVFYMILVSILLVNMLIAMMGKTYQDIASRPNEWLRQWARIVLVVERGVSPPQRLKFQQKYCQLRNSKKVFIQTWETSELDMKNIDEIKELKNANIKMRNKKHSKFN